MNLVERLKTHYFNPLNGRFEDDIQVEDDCHEAADRMEALEGLLKAASCPQCGPNKDGAYYDNMGQVHQCQWCYEVEAALKGKDQ